METIEVGSVDWNILEEMATRISVAAIIDALERIQEDSDDELDD